MNKKKVKEGYRVIPPIDKEKYQERKGLEGPFRARNGKVYYYDPKIGMAYDPDTDIYIEYDELELMNRDPDMVYENDDWRERTNKMYGKDQFKYKELKHELGHEKNKTYPVLIGGWFYLIPDDMKSIEQAKFLGMKRTKSGKWMLPVYDKSGRTLQYKKSLADQEFGKGNYWEAPKKTFEDSVSEEIKPKHIVGGLALVAALMGMDNLTSAKHTPLGKALTVAAQQGDQEAAKYLKDLDFMIDSEQTALVRKLSDKYLHKKVQEIENDKMRESSIMKGIQNESNNKIRRGDEVYVSGYKGRGVIHSINGNKVNVKFNNASYPRVTADMDKIIPIKRK